MSENDVFAGIDERQYVQLKDALSLITILIAGADGTIDEQELNWAEKLTNIRSYAKPEQLNTYYQSVEEDFEESVATYLKSLPDDLTQREEEISIRLSDLNNVFACLSNEVAYQLYESFTSFAKHIAKASGGFLRFGSISSDEKEWIGLPMIQPVILEGTEDE